MKKENLFIAINQKINEWILDVIQRYFYMSEDYPMVMLFLSNCGTLQRTIVTSLVISVVNEYSIYWTILQFDETSWGLLIHLPEQ